mgnify:CR=1 FL=1
MTSFLFYFFAVLAVLTAIRVISAPKPTRALIFLILTMFALAVIYLLLNAYFVAMVHLIVYAGAVLVLFLFVIMLQGTGVEELPLSKRFAKGHVFFSGVAAAAFMALLISVLLKNTIGLQSTVFAGRNSIIPARLLELGAPVFAGDTKTFGISLFQDYLLPFELTSLLLLIGVFAAVSLAKKDDK